MRAMMNMPSTWCADCTGLVMAGGAGRRMGDSDKGLLAWGAGTLASHACQRLAANGLTVLLSANRNAEAYRAYGHAVVTDRRADYQGPLAALEAGLLASATPWLIAVPCDSPFFPDELPARLWQAVAGSAPLPGYTAPMAAYVRCGEAHHPVFCILSTTLGGTLSRFLEDGGRRMTDWWQAIGARAIDFGTAAEPAFANANTPADYELLRAREAAWSSAPC
jgi:molybdopterin-guanine dinucleotide biosynthesis protein A